MTNVALVVLDTLRKDTFDRYFDWLPGRRFERAYTTANWTVPAHASLFTGRYASEVGTHAKNMHLDCSEPVLAERLRKAGYTTRAFTANPQIMGHIDFDRGITDFRVPKPLAHLANDDLFDWTAFTRETSATGWKKYFAAVCQCLRSSDTATLPSLFTGVRTFMMEKGSAGVKYGGLIEARAELDDMTIGDSEFLFVNLMEAHEPFRVPKEYRTVEEPDLHDSIGDLNFEEINIEQTRRAYDDCAQYLSDGYKELFGTLIEEFEYVITLADHGEMLGEGGAWGHEHGVHPALTHVPLVISGNGLDGDYTEPVSLLDVHATILDMAGVDGDSRGRTLLEALEGRESLTEYLGLTSWSEREFTKHNHEDQLERYDQTLRGYVSPDGVYGYESLDGFVVEGTDDGADLIDGDHDRERLKEWFQRLVEDLKVRDVETDNDVPDEIKDRLKDLGYA